jgi:hypothetical protein
MNLILRIDDRVRTWWVAIVLILVTGLTPPVIGQMPTTATPPGWTAALPRLFGETKAFSAQADMRAVDKAGQETVAMTMGFAMLDRQIRMAIDIAQIKSSQMPPGAAAAMKQIGMDRTVAILMPQRKIMVVMYPLLQSYLEMPLPDQMTLPEKDVKLEKSRLGTETIDGHSCVKFKVVITDSAGQKNEGIVWNATDLKEFSVQMQMQDRDSGGSMTTRFREIKLVSPGSKDFEIPAGYKKYSEPMQLMQAAAARITSSAKPASSGGKTN